MLSPLPVSRFSSVSAIGPRTVPPLLTVMVAVMLLPLWRSSVPPTSSIPPPLIVPVTLRVPPETRSVPPDRLIATLEGMFADALPMSIMVPAAKLIVVASPLEAASLSAVASSERSVTVTVAGVVPAKDSPIMRTASKSAAIARGVFFKICWLIFIHFLPDKLCAAYARVFPYLFHHKKRSWQKLGRNSTLYPPGGKKAI